MSFEILLALALIVGFTAVAALVYAIAARVSSARTENEWRAAAERLREPPLYPSKEVRR